MEDKRISSRFEALCADLNVLKLNPFDTRPTLKKDEVLKKCNEYGISLKRFDAICHVKYSD